MSNDEATQLMDQMEDKYNHDRRRDFVARMERKLARKERGSRAYR